MSIFEQAARLNNEGVTSLSNGDNQTAIDKLTQSIKWMKQALSKPGTDSKILKSNTTVHEEATQTVEIPEVDSVIAFNQAITIPSTSGQDENVLDIHVYSVPLRSLTWPWRFNTREKRRQPNDSTPWFSSCC
jgi:hypothetical protein